MFGFGYGDVPSHPECLWRSSDWRDSAAQRRTSARERLHQDTVVTQCTLFCECRHIIKSRQERIISLEWGTKSHRAETIRNPRKPAQELSKYQIISTRMETRKPTPEDEDGRRRETNSQLTIAISLVK